jgi:hypothetical protein
MNLEKLNPFCFRLVFRGVFGVFLASCASATAQKYCTRSGQPARERDQPQVSYGQKSDPKDLPRMGDVQCELTTDKEGQIVKEGNYIEWFSDGKPAIRGEYREGKKTGKWLEWDRSGKLVSERWFEDGVETPNRDTIRKGTSQNPK